MVSTVTEAVPAEAIKEDGMSAVSCPELTKVVEIAFPFQTIWLPEMKFMPLSVRVKPGPPATAELGDRLVSVGTGLMVKVLAGGSGCPDWLILTVAVPALAIKAADTVVVTFTDEINWVGMLELFQRTTVAPVRLDPLTVRTNPGPPAVAWSGEMLLMPKGPLMVKVRGG